MNQTPPGVVAGTTPYPWPFDRGLSRDRLAVLVCGVGTSRVGSIPEDAGAEANIDHLRRAAAAAEVPVFLIDHDIDLGHLPDRRHGHDPGPGPWSSPLLPTGTERVVHAAGVDGFFGSALDAILRAAGIDELIVIGRGFETTVHSTIRTANDAGYECLTVPDACLTIDASCRSAAISTIEMSGGIFGAVGSTRNVLLALELVSPVPSSLSTITLK